MPLTRFVLERVAQIRALIDDPTVAAVEVRVSDELKVMAARLIVVAAEEGDTFNLPIGVTATFETADTLAQTIADAVAEEVESAQETLAGEQLAFPVPAGMRTERRVPVEVRLVEYVESVARSWSNHVDQLVLALDIAVPDEHEAAWADFLARLLANTGPGTVTWVLFTAKHQLEANPIPNHRWRAAPSAAASRLDAELQTLLSTPGQRLLTVPGAAVGAERVAQRLGDLGAIRWRTVVVPVPPVPFFSALFHCTEARREVARRVRALEQRAGAAVHAAPLFEEAEAAAAYPDAERAFVEFCERLVRAALRDGTRMVIVLSHVPNADPAEVDASLRRLATATVSSRVKLVVIEPRDKRPSPPIEMRTAVFAFDLDADAIERGLHERLADDDLTDVERLRFTTAASGWALSKGDAHLAMVYSLDALAQAQEMDDPREGLVAYYNLGNTLHQCQEYAEAARMYGEVAQTGMDDGQWVLAAQGLMGLGNTHFMREDPELADLSYEAAQALFASQNLRHFEAHALTWRGEAAVLAGRHGDALGFFESALKTCDAMDPSYASTTRSAKADVLLRIARLYELAGRPDQQREYQQQAREHGAAAPACHHP